jgi:SAM-dependent methyltransferase
VDRTRFSTIAHSRHRFLSPLDPVKVDRSLALLDLPVGASVLDAGCGKGEVVIRLLERYPAVRALGVDTNASFIEEGTREAARRVPDADLTLLAEPLGEVPGDRLPLDLLICTGSSQVFGDVPATLAAAKRLVRPGGMLLLADGYWHSPPSDAYLEALGAAPDEYSDLAGTIASYTANGFREIYSFIASADDWDHYEGLYAANVEQHVASHPDDPDGPAMLDRIRAWRRLYLTHGRGTLGFVVSLLHVEPRGREVVRSPAILATAR